MDKRHTPLVPRERQALQLTERERQVLRLASEGLNNQEIAEQLCIERRTVNAYFERIYTRLNVRPARSEAIHRFMRGW